MKVRGPTRLLVWLTVAFLVLVWERVLAVPALRAWLVAVPFSLLIVVSGLLHVSIQRVQSDRQGAFYIAAQLAAGAGAMLVCGGYPMSLTLFAPLVGEVFGIMVGFWARLLALAALAIVWLAVFVATGQTDLARFAAPGVIVGTMFIGIFVTLLARQIRERERAERLLAQLEEANSRLREYALRVEELTVTEERQRMARELHDTLAQGLAGLIMQLEAINDLLARGDSERARSITDRALQRARSALSEARVAIQQLRTPLERGNILQVIAELADEFRTDTGIECTVDVGTAASPMSGATASQVQRIVHEALTNSARHSGARHVAVRLSCNGDAAELEIIDDGCGFDPATVPPGHYGLIGLRERVRLAGGNLDIDSRPGAGTRLRATLPLTPEEVEADE